MSDGTSEQTASVFDMRTLELMSWYQIGCVAVFSLASAVLWSDGVVGIAAGGVVMAGNFWFMSFVINKVFSGGSTKSKIVYAVLLGGKFFAVMAVLTVLVLVLHVHPVGIAIGMFTLLSGVGLGLAHHYLAARQQPQLHAQ